MYLSRAVGIELKGEKLIGLVDGAQAIILTLLVIELPALIIESIEYTDSTSILAYNIATDLIGYLVAALIVFDIWSLQKATIDSTKPSRIQSLICIATLWLSSLVPVFFFLTEKFAQESFAEALKFETTASHLPELHLFRSILIITILSIYAINYLFIARFADPVNKTESKYVQVLAKVRTVVLSIIFIATMVFSSIFGVVYALLPLVIFIPIIFKTPKIIERD